MSIIKRDNEAEVKEYDEYDKVDKDDNYLCGGFLIHPRVVVTTAGCVEEFSPKDLEIRTGGWVSEELYPYIFEATSPLIAQQSRNVLNISLHSNYDFCTMNNNHALLLLSESFDLDKSEIGVIYLLDVEAFSLQCNDMFSIESSDNISCENRTHHKEKFRVCPLRWDYPTQFYYSGVFRQTRVSSSQPLQRKG